MVIAVRNQKGEEIARQVVGIGALQGGDQRTFDLSVEVFAPEVGVAAPSPTPPPPKAKEVRPSSVLSAARTVPRAKRNPADK